MPKRKIVCLRHEFGVDLEVFSPDRISALAIEEFRKRFQLKSEILTIGFYGRMIGAKGIIDLFYAFSELREHDIQVQLVYVGDVLSTDNDQKTIHLLKDLVKQSPFGAQVVFTGFQHDIPLAMAAVDIVVHPSHHEGFPRIPIEAGAMGKPSIITATSGCEIAVVDGKTGYIVPICDVKELAGKLEVLLRSESLRIQMGQSAQERIQAEFDQRCIVSDQIAFYNRFQ